MEMRRSRTQSRLALDAPNAAASGGEFLGSMVEALQLSYPVGYTGSGNVDAYLERSGNEMLSIPQVVVIDRAGMIRGCNGRTGKPRFGRARRASSTAGHPAKGSSAKYKVPR